MDAFHDIGIIDERNKAHRDATVGAFEQIDLVDLLSQLGPVGLAPCIDD